MRAWDEDAVKSGMFSIGDQAFDDGRVLEWFETTFGSKCRYER
jgi:hypothetical protein